MAEIYKNYVLKQPRQAARLHANNGDAIARWCGGDYLPGPTVDGVVDINQHVVMVPTLEGTKLCGFGGWISKNERGRFTVIENKTFQEVYMEGPVQPA